MPAALLRPVERNCGPGSPSRVSRLVQAWRVRTLLCPGGQEPVPLAASLRLRSTLRPAGAQPGPPCCARPRGAAGTARQTRCGCLGTSCLSCTRGPVLRGVTGRGLLLGALGTCWASLTAGRPRALALALGMAARGTPMRGPQRLPLLQASLGHPPLTVAEPQPPSPRGSASTLGGQAPWCPPQTASRLTGGFRGPHFAPRLGPQGTWQGGVEGWLVKQEDRCLS